MLTKKILVGMLVSLFCLGLSGAVIAGNIDKPYASPSVGVTSMNMEDDSIEFDYSPTENSGIASVPLMNTDSDVIEFDYSPRDDTRRAAVLPLANTDSEDIQFDYSPRELDCGTPYC